MTAPLTRQMLENVRLLVFAETDPLAEAQVHFLTAIDTDVSDLPDIVIFAIEDKPRAEGTDGAGGQERTFNFGVSISVASEDEADTDPWAAKVRKAVLQDQSLGGLAYETSWDSQEWGSGNGSKPTSMTKLTFTTVYRWEPEW